MRILPLLLLVLVVPAAPAADEPRRFQPMDVFDLEWAADPQFAPDGKRVAYVRNGFDIKKDRPRTRIWLINADGSDHRPLTDGGGNESSPRWSPDGQRLLYVSDAGGSGQLHACWLDSGKTARLTSLPGAPAAPAWSPDGKAIAFSAFVEEPDKPLYTLPAKPAGAEWADPPKIITAPIYRADGRGYLKPGRRHLFIVPADGGAARQLTSGPYDHCVSGIGVVEPPAWAPDGKALVIAAKRYTDADLRPLASDLYEVAVADRGIRRLTDEKGPAHHPAVSPDGKHVAYLGFDDRSEAYQATNVYLGERGGTARKELAGDLNRPVSAVAWAGDDLLVQYADRGDLKVVRVPVGGKPSDQRVEGIGGTDVGRPYTGGSFSAARDGRIAFTQGSPSRPSEVAVWDDGRARPITHVSDALLAHRDLGTVEEVEYPSSHDKKKVHGWVVKPPAFDPKQKYPLILEIHGGPYADYGPTFAAEMQLYAAAGYVVLYVNPRGSTSYGEDFARLINHAYPGNDYDDLMAGVDAVIQKGYVDANNLFVTGGSGGGILTAWIVGKTDRFRAAVSAKPIINWESGTLTTDISPLMAGRWFARAPWDQPEEYRKRSPLSLVGNVKTPTMLLTGEEDWRTPMSESEQFYTALKLRKVDAALVRFPGASHAIVDRPSRLVAKTGCILAWFEKYRQR